MNVREIKGKETEFIAQKDKCQVQRKKNIIMRYLEKFSIKFAFSFISFVNLVVRIRFPCSSEI